MSWPICRARPSRQLRLFRLLQREGKIMLRQDRLRALIACVFVLVLSLSFPALAAKDKSKKKGSPKGPPVLWREPVGSGSSDLHLRPGGAQLRPDLHRLRVIREAQGG